MKSGSNVAFDDDDARGIGPWTGGCVTGAEVDGAGVSSKSSRISTD